VWEFRRGKTGVQRLIDRKGAAQGLVIDLSLSDFASQALKILRPALKDGAGFLSLDLEALFSEIGGFP
jgi:hypothetical protein